MSYIKIGVIGLWHLGCVLCACWSKLGNKVVGVDFNEDIIASLKRGTPPIFEPNLEDIIKISRQHGMLNFSTTESSLSDSDFVFISYDTPVFDDNSSDVTPLLKAIKKITPYLRDSSVIIVSSQSPVGLCSKLRSMVQNENPTIELVYSPENLRLGEAIDCYLNPERIIIGVESQEAKDKAVKLFEKITHNIIDMDLTSAEMVKHGINSFLATCITFVNHLADLCEYSGADILSVIKGMKTDPRIGKESYLNPGIGFSGGTLGRDLKILEKLNSERSGKAKLFEQVYKYNTERKFAIVEKVKKILGGNLKEKSIGVLGVTYKPNTSTLRRSLPLEIIDIFQEIGARVKVFDPKADYNELIFSPPFTICHRLEKVFQETDIIILLTEWPEFKKIDWKSLSLLMNSPIIFDTKNFLTSIDFRIMNIQYYGIGR